MDRVDILERLKEIILETDKDNVLTPAMIKEESELVRDLGFNSFKMLFAAVLMEERMNCRINNEEYKKIKTVGDVIDLLLSGCQI